MLSIIIPAYNAEKTIGRTLREYVDYFSAEYEGDFEILIVANGCTDRTSDLVLEQCARFPEVRHSSFEGKIGKGGAIIEGFKAVTGDIVGFVDADNSTAPPDLHRLVAQLDTCSGTIGSRWLPTSNVVVKQPLPRRAASRGFNLLVRLAFRLPFADTQCGAKVFKKAAIDDVIHDLKTPGFAFDVELLYRLQQSGHRMKEVPITWKDGDRSTLDLKATVPAMFLAVVRLRLLNSAAGRLVDNQTITAIYRRVWIEHKAGFALRRAANTVKRITASVPAALRCTPLANGVRVVTNNRVVSSVYNYVGSRR